jgi:SAM-dependent methyltransferase
MAGDYGRVAAHIDACAREFVGRLGLASGERVLDVACGTGNIALAAARAGARVTGVDIATNLLDQARQRARAEGLTAHFDEGNAEQLPYPDAGFDVVLSMFGVMFAPRPEVAAAELLRVCRPGGRVALANWTPDGFAGQMFKVQASHVPPPPGVVPPSLWGVEQVVRERLGGGTADLRTTRRLCSMRYPFPPGEVVAFFERYFGPTQTAFAALDAGGQAALRRDLESVWSRHNHATDGTTYVEGEYLEVVAVKR